MRERLTPLYFGSLGSRLFGCLHQPGNTAGKARDMGVILCAPQGHEYIQFHRALRQLALQLTGAGYSVLRFDFSGCGDSAGAEDSWGLSRWENDLSIAIEELKQQARVERVGLIGLRLGATLATQVAGQRDDVDALVLWDPVVDGAAYLNESRAQHERMLSYAHVLPASGTAEDEILGFALPQQFMEELQGVDLLAQHEPLVERLLLIESNDDVDQGPLREHLSNLGAQVEHRRFSNPHLWVWVEDFGKVHVPRRILESLVSWLGEVPA